MVERYIFSGSLPEDATTYVTREADTQLYEGLKAGKFCYVLNSRQTGKSSLRVRTMRRLREEGFSCVAIDLSSSGIQSVSLEQWYVDLLDTLIDSLDLDIDLEEWWFRHKLLSPLKRFGKFIEEVLLVEVRENIIIFIDEIDSVLSLKFPTDDFFAFIRACYNQRADNHKYRRISFCLLGVASPSELIADKKRTPFNIARAIFLKGFQWQEVEPLKTGLMDKVDDLNTVIKEILEWTGGQPFLTQKLCQFVFEESDQDQPHSVEEIVKERIITNWESQDEPEHLRTIKNRILSNEQRAGYLLELYRNVLTSGQIPLNNSFEERELQLSGLVVKRGNDLQVYNPIYAKVFDESWIDSELGKLRPYAENYRTWLRSGKKDASRLLRGQALQDAETWALGKNLGGEDRDFLGASRVQEREEKIVKKEKEAELERERKAKEVAEAANRKAQRRIFIGSIFLGIALLGAGISTGWGYWKFQKTQTQLERVEEALEAVRGLSTLAGELRIGGSVEASDEALRKAGLSTLIKNEELKQTFLLAATAEAYQSLGDKGRNLAENTLNNFNLDYLENNKSQLDLGILNQVKSFAYFQIGKFKDKKYYQKAYNTLKTSNFDPFNPNIETDVLNEKDVENIHWELIKSLDIDINSETHPLAKSFRQHLYDGLEFLLKKDLLQAADQKTFEIMLYIASRKEEGFFTAYSLRNFNCNALQEIDSLWYTYPKHPQHFGFGVQKEIWQKNGSPYQSPARFSISRSENWKQFYIELGWVTEKSGIKRSKALKYEDLDGFKNSTTNKVGNLPHMGFPGGFPKVVEFQETEEESSSITYETIGGIENSALLLYSVLFSRAANCNL
ncbi:MAG: AAA-like domain-containing protein [Xenococcus sp. (in: cyanobacteria)]